MTLLINIQIYVYPFEGDLFGAESLLHMYMFAACTILMRLGCEKYLIRLPLPNVSNLSEAIYGIWGNARTWMYVCN